MSIRYDILGELKQKIEEITVDNGYNTNINTVSLVPLGYDITKSDMPLIFIMDEPEEKQIADDVNVRFKWPGEMRLFLSDLNKSAVEIMSNFIDDVKSVIYNEPNLGDYCLQIKLDTVDAGFDEANEMAVGNISFHIIYYAPRGSF